MKKFSGLLLIALVLLTACNKSSNSIKALDKPSATDAVQEALLQYSGSASAINCGRLDVHATPDQLKAASDCALQAHEGKRPFYVAYDMPGMSIGVAGNADAKLFSVQTQGSDASQATPGPCPAQLRVASSGRVTCFAPGDMGSMGAGHGAGAMPPGMANPHGGDTSNPHGAPPSK